MQNICGIDSKHLWLRNKGVFGTNWKCPKKFVYNLIHKIGFWHITDIDIWRPVLKYYPEYFCHWPQASKKTILLKNSTQKKFGNLWMKFTDAVSFLWFKKPNICHICMVILLPWPTDIAHFRKFPTTVFSQADFFSLLIALSMMFPKFSKYLWP